MLIVEFPSVLDRWSELLESAIISLVIPGSVFAFGEPTQYDRGTHPSYEI